MQAIINSHGGLKVHSLLDSLGLSYIWSNQIHTIESFKRIVKQRIMDQFIQEWQSRVADNSVCSNYRLFKKKFCFEKYLTYFPSILRQRVLKFNLVTTDCQSSKDDR